MKTALRISAPFNVPPIDGRMHDSIRGWNHEPFKASIDPVSVKFLNHHQYNIPNTTISIVVANGVRRSVSSPIFLAYQHRKNECCLVFISSHNYVGGVDLEN
jgi:hypothetical protein